MRACYVLNRVLLPILLHGLLFSIFVGGAAAVVVGVVDIVAVGCVFLHIHTERLLYIAYEVKYNGMNSKCLCSRIQQCTLIITWLWMGETYMYTTHSTAHILCYTQKEEISFLIFGKLSSHNDVCFPNNNKVNAASLSISTNFYLENDKNNNNKKKDENKTYTHTQNYCCTKSSWNVFISWALFANWQNLRT